MTEYAILGALIPLLTGLACWLAVDQIRTQLRSRRVRRITDRLIEY